MTFIDPFTSRCLLLGSTITFNTAGEIVFVGDTIFPPIRKVESTFLPSLPPGPLLLSSLSPPPPHSAHTIAIPSRTRSHLQLMEPGQRQERTLYSLQFCLHHLCVLGHCLKQMDTRRTNLPAPQYCKACRGLTHHHHHH